MGSPLNSCIHTTCNALHAVDATAPQTTAAATMKLTVVALLLTAVHAKLAPVHLAKKSGVKAVQAIDLGGGKKAAGGYGQWAKDNAAASGSA